MKVCVRVSNLRFLTKSLNFSTSWRFLLERLTVGMESAVVLMKGKNKNKGIKQNVHLNAKTLKASSSRLLITGLFFSKQGTEEHMGARGCQSGKYALQGLLMSEVFGTAISVVKGRDAAKHLKIQQAGPTQQRIEALHVHKGVRETAPRQ